MTASTYRVIVAGSRDWSGDVQETRLALIHATAAHQDAVIVIDQACPAAAAAAEWASDYGFRTEGCPL